MISSEKLAADFFIARAIEQARSLPIRDARSFLKGLLLIADQSPEVDPIRPIYAEICSVDTQLEKLQLTLI